MRQQRKRSLLDDRESEIQRRLGAFDLEAEESELEPEVVAELRGMLAEELRTAASLVQTTKLRQMTDFQALLGRHRVKESQKEACTRFDYPNSDM